MAFLLPAKGRYGLRDYEKIFCPDRKGNTDIFDMPGIDRERGCMVVVRPDQYVADVLPLDAHAELAEFLRSLHAASGLSGDLFAAAEERFSTSVVGLGFSQSQE